MFVARSFLSQVALFEKIKTIKESFMKLLSIFVSFFELSVLFITKVIKSLSKSFFNYFQSVHNLFLWLLPHVNRKFSQKFLRSHFLHHIHFA